MKDTIDSQERNRRRGDILAGYAIEDMEPRVNQIVLLCNTLVDFQSNKCLIVALSSVRLILENVFNLNQKRLNNELEGLVLDRRLDWKKSALDSKKGSNG